MTWLESAIAQRQPRLEIRLAWSTEMVFDWLDQQLINKERGN